MHVLARMGQQARVRIGDGRSGATPFEFGVTVSRLDGNRLQVDTALSAGMPMAVLGSPRLVVRDGEKASVSIDTGAAAGAFTISLTPKVVAGSVADAIDARKPPAVPAPPAQPLQALPALPPVPSEPLQRAF